MTVATFFHRCHCVPGTYGVDCSLGAPDHSLAGTAAATMARELEDGSPHGSPLSLGLAGWAPDMLSAPAPALPAASARLRIYVYDLPPRFNTWLAAHFRRSGRWDQSYLYAARSRLTCDLGEF